MDEAPFLCCLLGSKPAPPPPQPSIAFITSLLVILRSLLQVYPAMPAEGVWWMELKKAFFQLRSLYKDNHRACIVWDSHLLQIQN